MMRDTSLNEMCVIARRSWDQAATKSFAVSFAACAFGYRSGVSARNHDFHPPVLGAAFRGLVVGNRRGFALAVGLQALRLSEGRLEQSGDTLGAFDRQLKIGGEAN